MLIAAVIEYFTHIVLDGWMGLAVALFILYSGIGIMKDTLNPLLGEAPTEELSRYIANKNLSYKGVLGTHDLMVHDYGPGRRFGSVHVEMDRRDGRHEEPRDHRHHRARLSRKRQHAYHHSTSTPS